MKIYLAARYSRYPEMINYAEDLKKHGHTVTSRWIWGSHQIKDEEMEDQLHAEKRMQFAKEDLDDLMRAECVISFTEEPRTTTSRGGRHVEFGIAYATKKKLYVVGHRENVFHCLSEVIFVKKWEECLKTIVME